MFSEGCPPLPWDKENAYTRDAVELYYEVYNITLSIVALFFVLLPFLMLFGESPNCIFKSIHWAPLNMIFHYIDGQHTAVCSKSGTLT